MADNFGVYDISGDVLRVASSSLETALRPLSGNINIRRFPQRELYTKRLLGKVSQYQVAEASYSTTLSASVPSWTQHDIGKKHAFVISPFSASSHFTDVLNARASGTVALETSAVPASGTEYYTKQNRFVKLMYKLSASANLPVTPASSTGSGPSTAEMTSPRGGMDTASKFHPISGAFRNSTYSSPAEFEINVPEYGRIRDIKVWVELVHDIRSASYSSVGLGHLQIALRSPNVSFPYSHPMWNDPATFGFEKVPESGIRAPELLKNSYLLWAGHKAESDLSITLGNTAVGTSVTDSNKTTVSISASAYITSLATDKLGNFHLAFSHEIAGPGLIYGKVVDSSFTIKQVFSTGSVDLSTNYRGLAIAVDKNSIPGILFADNTTPNVLKYAYSGSTWTYNTIDTALGSEKFGDLGIVYDSQNDPHIIYTHSTQGILKYGKKKNGVWITSSLDSVTGHASIDIDSDDTVHIAYVGTDDCIVYAKTGSFGLHTENLPVKYGSDIYASSHLSIAVDDESRPHIAYQVRVGDERWTLDKIVTQRVLCYAFSGSNGWTLETLEHGGDGYGVGDWCDIDIDSQGNPHICYEDIQVEYEGLGYHRKTDLGWSKIIVNRPAGAFVDGELGQIRVDVDDGVGIFCSDIVGTTNLYYFSGALPTPFYYEFDRDIDMRTIFTDSSKNYNPRHLGMLYDLKDKSLSRSEPLSMKMFKAGAYHSPTSGAVYLFGDMDETGQYNAEFGFPEIDRPWRLSGANFPWMLDSRINPGNFVGRRYSYLVDRSVLDNGTWPYQKNTMPTSSVALPAGWITGQNGTASLNEFQTYGMQIGPEDILPVYPLLDDVYVEKFYDEEPYYTPGSYSIYSGPMPQKGRKKFIGFRPGLRGTEIHGKWKLLIGTTGNSVNGYWFRQFRIEFLVDQGVDIKHGSYSSKDRRFKKSHYVAAKPGNRLWNIVSGSAAWDIGINKIYIIQPEEYGRSVGITDSSETNDFAVFSRITGSLTGILSGSGDLESVEDSYLANEFGTPYIPLSAGSAEIPTFDAFDTDEMEKSRTVFNDVLNPKTLISKDNTLKSFIKRSNVVRTTRDQILQRIIEESSEE